MKKLFFSFLVLLLTIGTVFGQAVLELEPSQSMSITGKGPGQDAAINPYLDVSSIGVVENIGKNDFVIRIQKKGEVLEEITISPGETKEVILLKGHELYFDSKLKARAKIYFKKQTD